MLNSTSIFIFAPCILI